MSVTLSEVLADAGYDIKNNPDDANWLLSQESDFEELYEEAETTRELFDEYLNYTLDYDITPLTFTEWREEKEAK